MKLPNRRQFLHLAASAAALPGLSRIARAQGAYPSRPITLVVGFAAGGPTDVYARLLAEAMQRSLGVPVIVENAGGAGASLGAGRVARANPDGYTLSVGPGQSTHVINAVLYDLSYDVVKDFEPVALISFMPHVILAKKAMPADDLKGFVAWLKANPDVAFCATSGVGSPSHYAGILFQKGTGTRFRFVPYRGLSPALQDLVAGRVDFTIDSGLDGMQFVRAGTIKAYAVMGKQRAAAAPEIPTVDEAGMPGLYSSVWQAMFAPKNTPKDVVAKINAAVVAALADPALRARFAALGHEIVPREQQTPEVLAALQKAEIEKWWPLLKEANVKGE
jgi:tripartite-type tricarboxylate transporter receptor subunit TctC